MKFVFFLISVFIYIFRFFQVIFELFKCRSWRDEGGEFYFLSWRGWKSTARATPIVTGRNVFHQLDCSIQNCTVHTSPVKKKCEEHFPIDRKRCFDCRGTCVHLRIVSLTSSRPVFHFYTHKSLHHTFPRHQSRLEEKKNKKKTWNFGGWGGGL